MPAPRRPAAVVSWPPPPPLWLLLVLLVLLPVPPRAQAAAAADSPPARGRSLSPTRNNLAPGAAFHAQRTAVLRRDFGLRQPAGARPLAAPPRFFLSAVGERDALADDAHPPAAAIRHPSFNASLPGDPAAAAAAALFVRRAPAGNGSGGLHLGDGPRPWVAIGLSWPDAVLAAVEEDDDDRTVDDGGARPAAAETQARGGGGGGARRAAVSRLLAHASRAGFNALRVLALPSGAQPAPGALSARHLDALDWLVAGCRAHGLRLLLVLADAGPPPPLAPAPPAPDVGVVGAGAAAPAAAARPAPESPTAAVSVGPTAQDLWPSHARQYAAWVGRADPGPDGAGGNNGRSLPAATLGLRDGFLANDTVKSVFLDAAAAVVGRRNARVDGLAYRHDPTVLGWELLAGAHPGCCCVGGAGGGGEGGCGGGPAGGGDGGEGGGGVGDPAAPLRVWARQVAGFLRKKDPHHLIALGGDGLMGASSPHLAAAHNPPLPLASEVGLCGRACAAGGGGDDGVKDGRRSSGGSGGRSSSNSGSSNSSNSSSSGSGSSGGSVPWTVADALNDWHDLTSSVPDLDLAMAAVAPWRFGGAGAAGAGDEDAAATAAAKGASSLAGAACRKGAWGRGPDDGSGGACPVEKNDGGAVASWARGWVRAHQRDSLRLLRPLLLTVEVEGGGEGAAGGKEGGAVAGVVALSVAATDLMRAVDERRAPSAGLFVSVGRGWRDGRGVAAVLRAAARGGGGGVSSGGEGGEEGEEEGEVALLRLLAVGGDSGGGGAVSEAAGQDSGSSWRRFYHGGQEEGDDGGMAAAAADTGLAPLPKIGSALGGERARGPDDLDGSAREVLRVVGMLSAWLRRTQSSPVHT